MRHEGRCHCGNISVSFTSAKDPATAPLRACGCTFCRRHGAVWTTDPAGTIELSVRDEAELSRYRFGLGTSEFLLCRRCGVLVAAVARIDGAWFAALQSSVLEDRDAFTQPPQPVDFDDETAEGRIARRRRAWTPAVLSLPAPPPAGNRSHPPASPPGTSPPAPRR